jgi:hypothetical protein
MSYFTVYIYIYIYIYMCVCVCVCVCVSVCVNSLGFCTKYRYCCNFCSFISVTTSLIK